MSRLALEAFNDTGSPETRTQAPQRAAACRLLDPRTQGTSLECLGAQLAAHSFRLALSPGKEFKHDLAECDNICLTAMQEHWQRDYAHPS